MPNPSLSFGPFAFDTHSRILRREGTELLLPPRVVGVLEVLVRRAGDVVPRQELIDSVWKDAFVTDTSLAEAVSVLRQALGDDPQAPSYIQTLHRRGYRFVAPVAETGTVSVSAGVARERVSAPVVADVASETVSVPVSAAPAIAVRPSIGRDLVPWSIAAIAVILAGVAVRQAITRRNAGPAPVTRFAVTPLAGTRFDTRAPSLAVSADASHVAWSACDESACRLYVRPSDRLDIVPIAGTDDAAAPFFSPDGRSIGFFADGHLKKVALTGGAPVTLADAADPLGGAWTRDGRIVYAGAAPGLRVVRETGGEPEMLTSPHPANREVRHAWPALHPAADLMSFTIVTVPDADVAGRIGLLRLDRHEGSWTTLVRGAAAAKSLSADVLVMSRRSELQAAAFDARRGTIVGAPQTVLANVARSRGVAQFATSATGTLLSIAAPPAVESRAFFWSAPPEAAAPARELDNVRLSPDGRRVIGIDRSDDSGPDIWIADLERGTSSRLTHGGANAAPVWSADGSNVYFASSDGGAFAIHRRDGDSMRAAERIYAAPGHAIPASASPDGTLLALVSTDAATGADVWGLPLTGGPVRPLVRTAFDDIAATFSPNGRLIAYQSNDAGRWEVYVHRRTDQRRVTISSDGGTHPFWSGDGRHLFFRSRGRLMRVAVSADASSVGHPELVAGLSDADPIGAAPDGRILYHRRSGLPADAAILTLQSIREARQILGPPPSAMPR